MDYKQDYYDILGVTPDADQVVVRAAYKALIYKYHPDRNREAIAADMVTRLTEAVSVIGDEMNRLNYDLHRSYKTIDPRPASPSTQQVNRAIRGGMKQEHSVHASSIFARKRVAGGIAGLLIILIIFFFTVAYARDEIPLPPPQNKVACSNHI